MIFAPRAVRLVAVGAALAFLAIALAIRALAGGALEQHSGTLLYGSMVYAAVLFCWTRATASPLVAGTIAIAFCWLVECAQLTGVPAELSARSLLARLVLGIKFDPTDLVWYPVGIVPLVAAHWLLNARARRRRDATASTRPTTPTRHRSTSGRSSTTPWRTAGSWTRSAAPSRSPERDTHGSCRCPASW